MIAALYNSAAFSSLSSADSWEESSSDVDSASASNRLRCRRWTAVYVGESIGAGVEESIGAGVEELIGAGAVELNGAVAGAVAGESIAAAAEVWEGAGAGHSIVALADSLIAEWVVLDVLSG